MNANEALRKVEAKFMPMRMPAASDRAWQQYHDKMLSDESDSIKSHVLIAQGFDAGYQAALTAAAAALSAVQTEALREDAAAAQAEAAHEEWLASGRGVNTGGVMGRQE